MLYKFLRDLYEASVIQNTKIFLRKKKIETNKENIDLNEDFCLQFLEHLSPADASKLIAKITSFSKQEVYKFLLSISK